MPFSHLVRLSRRQGDAWNRRSVTESNYHWIPAGCVAYGFVHGQLYKWRLLPLRRSTNARHNDTPRTFHSELR